MRYIKEILKKNRIWVLVYIGLGIFNAFIANYKADYFQKFYFAGKLLYELFG